MHWVVQRDLYNASGFAQLIRALEAMGLHYTVHTVVPFGRELHPEVHPEGKVIAMGAYTMMHIARERGWSPGAYTGEGFDFRLWRAKWGDRLLNRDAEVGRLADIVPPSASFFVRPIFDSKSFSGQVMDAAAFEAFRGRILALGGEGTVCGETEILVCPKKTVYREYRTWIVDREVVTASLYMEGGRVRCDSRVDEAVIAFAVEAAAVWSPEDAYVLDVAETAEGLSLLEINCINASGFYEGNVGRIVMALEQLEARR